MLQELSGAAAAAHPASAHKSPTQGIQTRKDPPPKRSTRQPKAKETKKPAGGKSDAGKKPINFSAAMTALGKLDVTSEKATESKKEGHDGGGAVVKKDSKALQGMKTGLEVGGKEDKGGKEARELSPAVAAIFDAVNKSSGEGAIGKDGPANKANSELSPMKSTKPEQVVKASDGSTAALKNLLHIGDPSSSSSIPTPPAGSSGPPMNYSPRPPDPRIPHAILKLMRTPHFMARGPPQQPLPRPGLLPNPYTYPQQPAGMYSI